MPTQTPIVHQSTERAHLTRGESITPNQRHNWILPEVENQKIEISDLEIDPSLEEYLYTTQRNPTFVNALDTLKDWAINRKIEAPNLPKIDVRRNLGILMEKMNTINNKHK